MVYITQSLTPTVLVPVALSRSALPAILDQSTEKAFFRSIASPMRLAVSPVTSDHFYDVTMSLTMRLWPLSLQGSYLAVKVDQVFTEGK